MTRTCASLKISRVNLGTPAPIRERLSARMVGAATMTLTLCTPVQHRCAMTVVCMANVRTLTSALVTLDGKASIVLLASTYLVVFMGAAMVVY